MAAVGRFFGKFFGRTIGDAASFAIGGSISRTIDPVLQQVENESWQTAVAAGAVKPLPVGDLADIVAEDVERLDWGQTQAAQQGHGSEQFHAVYGAALNAPGIGELFQLWRRNLIGDGDFVHGLRKAKLEGAWDGPLKGLRDVLLSSEELAMMQQQGFVDSSRADSEGALQGVTSERQQLRFEASGLPPGVGEALDMLRRGIIDSGTFAQIVREGHTKTKYTDDLLALRDQVLHATDYAGLFLRGWITRDEMNAGGALTGYSPEQMDQLFLNRGRPATTHQVHIGYARGGRYIGETLTERETFDRAVKNSDVRPEYGDLLWQGRYTYPSAFVLRALVSDGTFTADQGETILIESGWKPEYAKLAAAKWSKGSTSAARDLTAANLRAEYEGLFITRDALVAGLVKLGYSPVEAEMYAHLGDAARVKSARDAVVKAVHDAFTAHEIQGAEARADLTAVGISEPAVDHLLPLWTAELNATRKRLTPAQIAAGFRRSTLTQVDALALLEAHGYSDAEAHSLLGLALPVLTVKQVQDAYKAGTITRAQAETELAREGYNPQQVLELLGAIPPPPPA